MRQKGWKSVKLVKVIFPPIMLSATGARETVISASTLEEALELVSLKYGDALKPWMSSLQEPWLLNLYVNGVHVQSPEQLKTKLKDGDVITLIPVVTGG